MIVATKCQSLLNTRQWNEQHAGVSIEILTNSIFLHTKICHMLVVGLLD